MALQRTQKHTVHNSRATQPAGATSEELSPKRRLKRSDTYSVMVTDNITFARLTVGLPPTQHLERNPSFVANYQHPL